MHFRVSRIGIALAALSIPALGAGDSLHTGKLAIFYGYPSLVNGAGGDTSQAAAVFAEYEVVVFGEVQDPSHPDHLQTKAIIGLLPGVEIYGYIPMGQVSSGALTLAQIQARTDDWNSMGVTGVFLDEAGWDYGVTRQFLNGAVQHAHSLGLGTFVNAWNPDDLFSSVTDPVFNPTGEATLLGTNDTYLLESYQIVLSGYQDPSFWASKADKAAAWRGIHGTRMATVTTVSTADPGFDQAKYDYAWYSTLLYGFELSGWGELFFSAPDSLLPLRARPELGDVGTSFTEAVQHAAPLHTRSTDSGTVTVDTSTHQGSFLPHPCHLTGLCSTFCFGDGSTTACPCGNPGAAGEGCTNSTGLGALLASSGTSSANLDDLVLHGTQLSPNRPSLFFGGNIEIGALQFGDGLRCVGGSIQRLQVVIADSLGTGATSIDIARKMGAVPGVQHWFQVWYRDPPGPCGGGFNLSNGLEVLWM